jgi:hypothetical protein
VSTCRSRCRAATTHRDRSPRRSRCRRGSAAPCARGPPGCRSRARPSSPHPRAEAGHPCARSGGAFRRARSRPRPSASPMPPGARWISSNHFSRASRFRSSASSSRRFSVAAASAGARRRTRGTKPRAPTRRSRERGVGHVAFGYILIVAPLEVAPGIGV